MAYLLEKTGDRLFELGESTIIGSDRGSEICLSDPALSEGHALIERLPDGRYKLTDSDSTYGTFVEGVPVESRVLRDGETIVVGGTGLLYCENRECIERHATLAEGEQADECPKNRLPVIESHWQSSEAFLEHFEPRDGPARLFVPVPAEREVPPPAVPGVLVAMQIELADRDAPVFRLHAVVLERHTGQEKRGMLVEFMPGERHRQDLVLACAYGESVPHFRRRHERLSCSLPVRLQAGERRRLDCTAVEIGEGGLGLVPDHGLECEMIVWLVVSFEREKIRLRGRVASIIPGGPRRGAGVEFLFESSGQRREVAEQVALLRSNQ